MKKILSFRKMIGTAVILCLLLASFAMATDEGYVTENDPLVSLSYITNVLKPEIQKSVAEQISTANVGISEEDKKALTDSITASVLESVQTSMLQSDEFKTMLSDMIAQALAKQSIGGNAASAGEFYTLTLTSGQRLKAVGKCEIILQSGTASVFCPTATSVKDVTAGKYLKSGDSIIKSHYIEISRADNSGIAATGASIVIAVRGEFTIEA